MAKKKVDAATKAKNLKQQENKTPELAAAKKAFEQYFKDNALDPTKDYTKDPVHGKKVTKLLMKLNKERDALAAKVPEHDKSLVDQLKKKAKKKAKNEAKVDALQKKAKEAKTRKVATKYEYPLIDGREMTSIEKKKYRTEQRKKQAGDAKPKKEEAKVEKKPKKVKKAKTTKKDED